MRFSLIPAFALLATLAATSPVAELETRTGGSNTCNGGNTYCCNDSPVLGNPTSGFLPIPINALATLTCSPLTILGIVLGTTCSKTTVCCQNVTQNGLINVGCIGVTV